MGCIDGLIFLNLNRERQVSLLENYYGSVIAQMRATYQSLIADSTVFTKSIEGVGGINFNADKINLEVNNDGQEIQFHFDPTEFENMNVDGFVPVIMSITPVHDLPLFLGINVSEPAPPVQLTQRSS